MKGPDRKFFSLPEYKNILDFDVDTGFQQGVIYLLDYSVQFGSLILTESHD